MTFNKLGVNPALVKTLNKMEIIEPFPIQVKALPDAINGKDVLGRGQTGSGKTLAFGLAVLTKLANRKAKAHHPLAIILSPTRELAMQINDVINSLAPSVHLSSRLVAGGMPYGAQIQALRKAVPILVSTPGRLMDLMDKKHVVLDEVEIVVLDEADQMADMGFLPDMKAI
ncbi:MAG: DEAD/DEAH box helicase, partial [Candidatus Nanopelagicales bacterium]